MKISIISTETNSPLPIEKIIIDESNRITIKVHDNTTKGEHYRIPPDTDVMVKIRSLSPRERQCMYYAAHGHTAKEISDILTIGKRTVESHIARAKSKLNLKNKHEIVQLISMDSLPKPEDFFLTNKS